MGSAALYAEYQRCLASLEGAINGPLHAKRSELAEAARAVEANMEAVRQAAATVQREVDDEAAAVAEQGAQHAAGRAEQSALQKLQRQAEAAAAAAAAVRDAHLGGLRKSASVPALLTSMRHRRPPQLKPLVRAARY